jgi:hypothetical protein
VGSRRFLHFTTHGGAVGILASKAVKSRKLLPEDAYLEHKGTAEQLLALAAVLRDRLRS